MSKTESEIDQKNREPIYKHATVDLPMKAAESSLFCCDVLVTLLSCLIYFKCFMARLFR